MFLDLVCSTKKPDLTGERYLCNIVSMIKLLYFFPLDKSLLFPSQKKKNCQRECVCVCVRMCVCVWETERERERETLTTFLTRYFVIAFSICRFFVKKEKIKSFVSTQPKDSESERGRKNWGPCQSLTRRTVLL